MSLVVRPADTAAICLRLTRVTAVWPWLVAERDGAALGDCHAGSCLGPS